MPEATGRVMMVLVVQVSSSASTHGSCAATPGQGALARGGRLSCYAALSKRGCPSDDSNCLCCLCRLMAFCGATATVKTTASVTSIPGAPTVLISRLGLTDPLGALTADTS
ncbi:hypothetical protein V5799_002192 [Amblyomma americanum]|uniref:Uncharacterized protein n=1 Tax=Amblyomma americanum TaxID=6943 RepID=A0AAQ4CY16_AMBAM